MGRPSLDPADKRAAIAIRVHPHVLWVFRQAAERRKVGYQTLIHEVLEAAAKRLERQRSKDVA